MVRKENGGCQPDKIYDPVRGCDRSQYPYLEMPEVKLPKGGDLTFEQLRQASYTRATKVFGHEQGLVDWSPAEWTNALAGEAGELCNLTKKFRRGDNISVIDIGREIADVIIYADLVATRMGFNLADLVKHKFNEVSDRKNSDIKL